MCCACFIWKLAQMYHLDNNRIFTWDTYYLKNRLTVNGPFKIVFICIFDVSLIYAICLDSHTIISEGVGRPTLIWPINVYSMLNMNPDQNFLTLVKKVVEKEPWLTKATNHRIVSIKVTHEAVYFCVKLKRNVPSIMVSQKKVYFILDIIQYPYHTYPHHTYTLTTTTTLRASSDPSIQSLLGTGSLWCMSVGPP